MSPQCSTKSGARRAMAAYTGRSRSTEAAVIPTCVSETMANRRLIARHAISADRYRTGTAWSFHQDITRTQARTGTIEPAAGAAANHGSVTSPWSEPPQSHIAVVRERGLLVPL